MQSLIAPTASLHDSWLTARREWPTAAPLYGHGLEPGDDIETADGFAAWVAGLLRQGDEAVPTRPDRVHATYRWIVEGDTYLGSINLRHRLNDFLLRAGGQIGYGVRPSARRRGLASWALASMLPLAVARGLDRVLVTCQDSNVASARTIERNGGVLENITRTEFGLTRRYWIDLRAEGAPR